MLGEFYFTSSKARYFIIHDSELFHILRQQNISLKLFPSVQSNLSKSANQSFSYPFAKNPECESVRDFYFLPLHYSLFTLHPSAHSGFAASKRQVIVNREKVCGRQRKFRFAVQNKKQFYYAGLKSSAKSTEISFL